MFTELMETSEAQDNKPVPSKPAKLPTTAPQEERLPKDLEPMSVGNTGHTYRFTEPEMRWLRRFCLKASEQLDKKVTHNSLIRALLRLAESEWNSNPERNRLRDVLSRLPD
jgi:hypothetical protein